MNRPLFIVFEGIDGSGKSTQVDIVFDFIQERGILSVKLREPTDSEWGKEIRQRLLGDEEFPVMEQLSLFIKDREHDAQMNIIPALNENKLIIMDRYYFSNAAYQGAMGLSWKDVIAENRKRNFPEPDRVYLIDITPEKAMERIIARNQGNSPDQFEKISFLEEVRTAYHKMSDERFCIIDGSGSVGEVTEIIKQDLLKLI